MDFCLTPEQEAFRGAVRDVAEREIAPRAATADRAERFPPENISALADARLLAIAIPRQYGGDERGALDYALAMEELAVACASTAVLVSVHNSLAADPLYRFGSEAQRARYLPPMALGEIIGAFCLTESSAGSDAASLRTRAVRDGAGYRLNGSK